MAKCSGCHTTVPANNVNNILNGANSPSTITGAISSNTGGMGFLSITATDANNLAAYLATPGI